MAPLPRNKQTTAFGAPHVESPLIPSPPIPVWLPRGTVGPTTAASHYIHLFMYPLYLIFFMSHHYVLLITFPSTDHIQGENPHLIQILNLTPSLKTIKLRAMEDSSSAAYIRLVHRLIEECILFNMSKEECMEALSKHANIKPVITATVWKELEKENKEFFEAYLRSRAERASERETRQRIQNVVTDSSKERV
ncbi:hypothetical protein CR513_48466, partial [Mucuna pruriens]